MSATDLAFRDEVRAFLDEKLTPELRTGGRLMTSVYANHGASMQWQSSRIPPSASIAGYQPLLSLSASAPSRTCASTAQAPDEENCEAR